MARWSESLKHRPLNRGSLDGPADWNSSFFQERKCHSPTNVADSFLGISPDRRLFGWAEVFKAHRDANPARVQGKCKLETGAAERPGAKRKLVGDISGPAVKCPGRESQRLQPNSAGRGGSVSGIAGRAA